jgi:hypothetical protein
MDIHLALLFDPVKLNEEAGYPSPALQNLLARFSDITIVFL